MKKGLIVLFMFLSLITLSSCKKKKDATVNLCCVDYFDMRDNYTGIDIIDEGCDFAKVDYWIIKCKTGDKVKVSVDVYEGYYIKQCYFNTVYRLDDATTVNVNSDNTVEVIAKDLINYVIFDIVKIEE